MVGYDYAVYMEWEVPQPDGVGDALVGEEIVALCDTLRNAEMIRSLLSLHISSKNTRLVVRLLDQ